MKNSNRSAELGSLGAGGASLVFLNRYFHPDLSATSQILSDLAFDLARTGHQVHVITSRQLYEDPRAALPASESIDGVQIHRVATTRLGRRFLPGRALDYLTFYLSATRRVLRLVRPGDTLIVKTDPPLIAVPAGWACRLRGGVTVQWAQDLFPEIAAAYGMKFARGPLGSLLRWLRNRAYRNSAAVVVLGHAMRQRLEREGIPAEHLHVLPNWSDGRAVRPVPPGANPLRVEWGLDEQFIVGYSGNLGRAHEADTVLHAARQLATQDPAIRFLFIGGGALREELERTTARENLSNLQLRPYEPRERLSLSLGVADVHLVSLRPDMEGLVFPSKLYGVLAAGRPVVFVGDPEGEIARLLRDNQCGFSVAQGDSASLAELLQRLRRDPELCSEAGRKARSLFERTYDKSLAMESWRSLLDSLRPG
jgi:colanic acid biosynthesis glycosyl transferase WcaI